MDLHSVKARFVGSYLIIILILAAQLPIMYVLIAGMSRKYTQVAEAASLKKRAVELSYILNRHIMNGEEELEKPFQEMKGDYGRLIESLQSGTKDIPPITDPGILEKLNVVKSKWVGMRASLDAAMDSGDRLSEVITEIEKTTPSMVEKLNAIVVGFVALNDQSYAKSINLSGLQRMRMVSLAYYMERFARSNFELEQVAGNIASITKDFDESFEALRSGSKALGLRPVRNPALLSKFKEAEDMWTRRKTLIAEGMMKKNSFRNTVIELSNTHTPQIIIATDEFTKEIAAKARHSAYLGLAVMALTVAVSIAITMFSIWGANRYVLAPLDRIKEVVRDYSRGDLSKRANVRISFLGIEFKDEITSLGNSVDEMAGQMSRVIGSIGESSSLLASASEQLSATSVQIKDGADRQSGQTAQVATAMEEMNATVVEVAKSAHQASESARGAENIAAKGGDVVKEAIEAMKEVAESTSVTSDMIKRLGKSSEDIGAIVSVINDIADQTNLLALNAAIEAARAGEQGRGFAVVADEVRKLAERTTKATKEINGMIAAIQGETIQAVNAMHEGSEKVERGTRLVDEAGIALGRIVVGVRSVTDIISHMATSTEEQSAATDDINHNMESIAEVAKSNVSAIGEVGKTTNEMARLAADLSELVARFTHGGHEQDIVRPKSGASIVRLSSHPRKMTAG